MSQPGDIGILNTVHPLASVSNYYLEWVNVKPGLWTGLDQNRDRRPLAVLQYTLLTHEEYLGRTLISVWPHPQTLHRLRHAHVAYIEANPLLG